MAGPGEYWIGKEEIKEVLDVLSSGHLSRYGKFEDKGFKRKVYTFEKEFAKYIGSKYCIAVSGGTSAIYVSLLALGIKPGDEVIVPGYTFLATYSAIIFAGGIPVLTEIDESLTIDPKDIEKKITPKTKFIVPVHMLGNPCDMDKILKIAKKHKLFVVEDTCQAVGGSYKGKKLGSLGVMGCYSLNYNKTIGSGDGGIIVTDSEDLYKKAFAIHDQGHFPLRAGLEVGNREILGMNFRMNELSGAVALAQLRKISKIVAALKKKKALLKKLIGGTIPGMKWRKINDDKGDCATLLTAIFDDVKKAQVVAKKIGSKTVNNSGWHVYSNMEHILNHLKKVGQPHKPGILPQSDDILSRSINLSVGVVDAGLGSGFGVNINSTDKEIAAVAKKFREAALKA